MKILGIDPGSTRAGYGLIETSGQKARLAECGLLKITSRQNNLRLAELAASFEKLVRNKKPDLISVEKLFAVKNITTVIDVAQSRGVIILIATQNKIPVKEFTPTEIKTCLTGYGKSDKKAVELMVKKILGNPVIKGPDDVSDAVAAAITGWFQVSIDKLCVND